MKQSLILFIGDRDEHAWLVQRLEDWSMQYPEIEFTAESIHTNPARVVQFRVRQLPALIFNGRVVVQGDPATWVPGFLHRIIFND